MALIYNHIFSLKLLSLILRKHHVIYTDVIYSLIWQHQKIEIIDRTCPAKQGLVKQVRRTESE